MAVEAVASTRTLRVPFVLALPVQAALAAVVAVSFVARSLLALLHVTPYYLPDEYLYPALARSLATTGHPLVRGASAHFPALLQPLLTAPLQLFDTHTAFRLTQSFDALAMSLAAIPVYLLARRLGLSGWFAVGCAAVAVTTPDMLYAGFTLADPVAYPLVLTAVYAGVCSLDRPTRRTQLAFLVWSGLATFTRAQYVVLPLAFVGAAVVLDRRHALRNFRFTGALLALVALATLALGPGRFAGVYSGGAHRHVPLAAALHWVGRDAVLLAYAAGWVLVPGALVGLLSVRWRVEKAFAAFTVCIAGVLIAESGWIAAIDSERFQERYLMTLLPLVPLAFGIYLRRGAPHRRVVAALAVALLLFSVRVPLSGYAALHGKDDSPVLAGVLRFEQALGVANGSLAVALAAGLLSLVAVGLAWRPRRAALLGLALTVAASSALAAGAYAFDQRNSSLLREHVLPADPEWVDHSGLKDVALLLPPDSTPERAFTQMIWNRSITNVFLLGPAKIDGYRQTNIGVSNDGRIRVPGGTYGGPLLVETYGSRAALTGAIKVATGKDFDLWRPVGVPRLALLAGGWYDDGWLAWQSFVSIWPDATGRVEGTLRLTVGMPVGGLV